VVSTFKDSTVLNLLTKKRKLLEKLAIPFGTIARLQPQDKGFFSDSGNIYTHVGQIN
jgi:hypothetical protein